VRRPTLRPTSIPVTKGKPKRRVVSRLGPKRGMERVWKLRKTVAKARERMRPQRRVAPVNPWKAGRKKRRMEQAESGEVVGTDLGGGRVVFEPGKEGVEADLTRRRDSLLFWIGTLGGCVCRGVGGKASCTASCTALTTEEIRHVGSGGRKRH